MLGVFYAIIKFNTMTNDCINDLVFCSCVRAPYLYRVAGLWRRHCDSPVCGALRGGAAFADGHCITLVKDGITESLLDLLAEQSSGDDSPTLQHAIFSALRNLAIPGTASQRVPADTAPLYHTYTGTSQYRVQRLCEYLQTLLRYSIIILECSLLGTPAVGH